MSVEPQSCDHKTKQREGEGHNVGSKAMQSKRMRKGGEEAEHKIITLVEYNERIGWLLLLQRRAAVV